MHVGDFNNNVYGTNCNVFMTGKFEKNINYTFDTECLEIMKRPNFRFEVAVLCAYLLQLNRRRST